MRTLLKYELNRLWYSYALVYASLMCVIMACVTQFVVAGNPKSPTVFGMAFEFFVPQMLVLLLPALFIAREQGKGTIKTSLLCGQTRLKTFVLKTVVYYLATIAILSIYLFILTLINIKGMKIQLMDNENSFTFFLRCSSIGFSYCIMQSSILLLIATLSGNSIITIISGLVLFFINFIMQATVDWRIADRIVPSAMLEAVMTGTIDMRTILSYILMVTITTIVAYVLSLFVFCKKNYK